MKSITFTVNYPESTYEGGFLADIKKELAQENREMEFTKSINAETRKAHYKVLEDIRNRLMNELEGSGIRFGNMEECTSASNGFYNQRFRLQCVPKDISITIAGMSGDVEGTRYITYPGEYSIQVGQRGVWNSKTDAASDCIPSILKRIRDAVKQHIEFINS